MFIDKRNHCPAIFKGVEEGWRLQDYRIYTTQLGLSCLISPWTGAMQAVPKDCYQCGRACNEQAEFGEALKAMSPAFKNITRQTQCFYKCKQHFKDKCLPYDTMKANCMRHCSMGIGAKLGLMFAQDPGTAMDTCYEICD